jgi:hypothetical protein
VSKEICSEQGHDGRLHAFALRLCYDNCDITNKYL